MGRKDAEPKQVSLAVEALEDRFLLSGVAFPPLPATLFDLSNLLAAAHNPAHGIDTRSASLQALPPPPSISQTTASAPINTMSTNYVTLPGIAPVNPTIGHQRDDDGDYDEPAGKSDGDPSHSAALGFPLSRSASNDAADGLNFVLPPGLPGQTILPPADLMSFVPLLSASGLGAMKTAPLAPLPTAPDPSEKTPEGHDLAPDKEELHPMPTVPGEPSSPLPPQVEQASEPPLPSSPLGPFAELLPIDVEAIQRGVDAFFQQLGALSEEWRNCPVLENLAPWLLAASVAGYGWIRLRDRRERCLADILGTDRLEIAAAFFLPEGK